MIAQVYLRASTKYQDANRARASLEAFAAYKGLSIAGIYSENISGTKLQRPDLMRLLETAERDEILLCESVDRLSRLTQSEWVTLKCRRGERIAACRYDASYYTHSYGDFRCRGSSDAGDQQHAG